MTNARVRFALLVPILFFAALGYSSAEHLEGTVMTVLITSASTVDERVERILTESVIVFLDRGCIHTVIGERSISGEEPSRRDISRLARDGGSSFVLIGTYNSTADSLSSLNISFTLYLADPGIPVATFQGVAEIDLTLDRTIADFLQILLNDAFSYLSETENDVLDCNSDGEYGPDGAEVADSQATDDPGGDTSATATGSSESESTDHTQADGATGTQAAESDGEESLPEIFLNDNFGTGPQSAPAIQKDIVEIALGYSPAFAVGGAADYYQFAHSAGGSVHLILGESNAIGIGIAGAALFATATGVATNGQLLIVPFSASFALRSYPSPLGAYLSVGGGGALIQITNRTLETFTKVVPYATAGVGMKLAFLDWIGINIGVSFDAIFEGSVLLTSFVPSISLYTGF